MLVFAFIAATPASSVEPDEILQDTALEERARQVSQLLRCLVCRNETIDESNAPLARDLRIIVRELIQDGKTDDEVIAHVVDRYGEFVLFKPPVRGMNWILYLAGPVLFLLTSIAAALYLRRRSGNPGADEGELSNDERAELERLVQNGGQPGGKVGQVE